MRIIDLTHTISEDTPVYPGTEPPSLAKASTLENDGFKETLMSFYSHTGTHMDPPAHIFEDGETLDEMKVDRFIGSGLVIDCRDIPEGSTIPRSRIERYGNNARNADFLLFNTGWDRFWGQSAYFGDYPYLAQDAVEFLLEVKPRGIGFDTIGIDPIADEQLTIHHTLLSQGMVFIENMTNLDLVGSEPFTLFALPLKWKNADGSPIRAVAVCQ